MKKFDGTAPAEYRTFFSVTELDRLSEEDGGIRIWERSRISFPGPAAEITPCVPSNISIPSNDYFEYDFYLEIIPSSDDDDGIGGALNHKRDNYYPNRRHCGNLASLTGGRKVAHSNKRSEA